MLIFLLYYYGGIKYRDKEIIIFGKKTNKYIFLNIKNLFYSQFVY